MTAAIAVASRAGGRPLLRGLLSRPAGRAGLALAACLVALVGLGPVALEQSPYALSAQRLEPPSLEHPLGTDQLGRDELARVLDGGRRSLLAAAIVLAGGMGIGLAVGLAAGMAGGVLDMALMRLVDALLAMPGLVLALALIGALGPSYANLVIALTLAAWPQYARLARSYVLAGRHRPDVVSARLAGIGWLRAGAGHLLPGAATGVLIAAALDVGHTILAIAGLSFLGLGIQPPTAEWGAMLADSRLQFAQAPWLLAGPAVAIVLAILAANLIGETLQDVADPRRRP